MFCIDLNMQCVVKGYDIDDRKNRTKVQLGPPDSLIVDTRLMINYKIEQMSYGQLCNGQVI